MKWRIRKGGGRGWVVTDPLCDELGPACMCSSFRSWAEAILFVDTGRAL